MKVYIVCSEANDNGPEAVFTDQEEAEKYESMGDMWTVALELDEYS